MNRIELVNTVSTLIIVRSPRVNFHPVLLTSRHTISPALCKNIEFVSLDEKLYRSLVVCKHCHMLFNNQRWNREAMGRHLDKFHRIDVYADEDEDEYYGKFNDEDSYNGKFTDYIEKHELEPINQLDQFGVREKSLPNIAQPLPVLEPSPVPSLDIIPKLCVQMQSGEGGVHALDLANDIDVASESMPSEDARGQVSTPASSVAIEEEQAAARVECTIPSAQVIIPGADLKPNVGDQVDFCSTLQLSTIKAKSTRKRTTKGAGGAGGHARSGEGGHE